MPQLDKVHFFSQYFWLSISYFGFYFLVAKHFLPRMARILQFRKNKLQTQSSENQNNNELNLVQESKNTYLQNVFNTENKFWSQNSKRMVEWYNSSLSDKNMEIEDLNKLYIKKVGSNSLSQSAALAGIKIGTPKLIHTIFLLQQLKSRNITSTAKKKTEGKSQLEKVFKTSKKSTLQQGNSKGAVAYIFSKESRDPSSMDQSTQTRNSKKVSTKKTTLKAK